MTYAVRIAILGLLASAGLACHSVPASAAVTPLAASPVDDAIATLRDTTAPDGVRQAAAGYLITQADLSTARNALSEELARPLGVGAGAYILKAIAAASDASSRLFPMLAQRVARSEPAELPRVLEALGSFRSRDAARLLVLHLGPEHPEPVRTAAINALVRLSGHDDFASDISLWTSWLREADQLSESQWRASLVSSFARRMDRLDAERRAAGTKLVEVLRRLHLATPAEQRSAFLAGLLSDASREVRDLGLELVSRELAASGSLGSEVGEAALPLLAADDPRIRAAAAGVVRQLAPANASEPLARALQLETDPAAAGALLIAATRWPSPTTIRALLHWLDTPGPAREKATDAAWQFYRAGELDSPAQEHVLASARQSMAANPTPAACALAAALGDSDDLAAIAPLLQSPDAPLRLAAADALAWTPEYADDIVLAASSDADLFDAAARAVLVHNPTAAGLRSVLALPRPSQEIADRAISLIASALPADELWLIVTETSAPVLRKALLRLLAAPERLMSEWADPGQRESLTNGIVAFAGVLIDDNAPAEALALLEDSPGFSHDSVKPCADLRCAALVALGRLEEADVIGSGPAPWFRGLSLSLTKPHAPAVLSRIEDRFAQDLNDEQKQVLQSVRATLAKPANGNGGSNGAPPR